MLIQARPVALRPYRARRRTTRPCKTVTQRQMRINQAFTIYQNVYTKLKETNVDLSSFRIPSEKFYNQIVIFVQDNGGGGGNSINLSLHTTFNNNNNSINRNNSVFSWQSKITIDLIVTIAILLSCISDKITSKLSLPFTQALSNTMKQGVPLQKSNFKMLILRTFLKNLANVTNKTNNFNKMFKLLDFLIIFINNFHTNPLFATYGFFAKPLIVAYVTKELDCN